MLQTNDYDISESLLFAEQDEEGKVEDAVLPSNNTTSDDRVPGRSACSTCGVILVVVTNIVTFIWLGAILCSFTHICESDYRHRKYQPEDDDWNETKRGGVRMELILLVAQIVVNLLMTWYLCIKPSKPARRTLRAGVAVFHICNRPRAHDEETRVPFATLLRQCLDGAKSAISACIAVSARLCLLSLLAFLPFALLCSKGDEGDCVLTQETTLAILFVYALVLWLHLWRSMLSQGDFLATTRI